MPLILSIQLGCDREPKPDVIVAVPPPDTVLIPEVPPNLKNPSENGDALALAASNILKEECSGCHSKQERQGNFGIVEDAGALIASGRYIIAGQPANSLLIKRLDSMPPGRPLSTDKKATLEKWIANLKVKNESLRVSRATLAEQSVKYIESIPENQRKGVRFFSVHNLYNAHAAASDVETIKKAFLKVLNSLSRSPNIIKPSPQGDLKLLFPVHLPSIGMKADVFDQIIAEHNPYCAKISTQKASEVKLAALTGSACSIIRMDWFTATAPLPKLYSKLLQQGETRIALDQQLGVDIISNVNTTNNVIRSGFRNSGVSSQSRIIERHLQSNGRAYWISYDFAALDGKANIFANPIGPKGIELPNNSQNIPTESVFEHDGGEVIYQLPNGLFAYYLADAAGTKIDKGPTQIVKQQGAPEQFVSAIVNGVSCMSCHGSGLIFKADQIKEFVANQTKFSADERDHVIKLYGTESELQNLIADDNKIYFDALKQMEIDYSKPDPVNEAYRIYNRNLTLGKVVAELDVETESDFINTILESSAVRFIWANINEVGAFLSREEFSLGLATLSRFELLRPFEVPSGGDYIITPKCMSENQVLMNTCFITDSSEREAD